MSDEFKINDKRLFTKDGQVNSTVAEAETPSKPTTIDDIKSEPTDIKTDTYSPEYGNLPPADFAGLVVGLATSAFIHLGDGPDQGPNKPVPDFAAARQAIDILCMLQAKTKGNLESEEESLLAAVLYDLRMKFIQATSGSPKG